VLDIQLRILERHSVKLFAVFDYVLTIGVNFRTFLSGSGIVAEQPVESYGKNLDRILEYLMGLENHLR